MAATADDFDLRVAEIFASVLGLAHVAADENFFECGGNSFAALTVVDRINEQFNCTLELLTFFEEATPTAIAGALRSSATRP